MRRTVGHKTLTQLLWGVFEPEHEEKKDDTERRSDVDKGTRLLNRNETSVSEEKTSDEIKGDGR